MSYRVGDKVSFSRQVWAPNTTYSEPLTGTIKNMYTVYVIGDLVSPDYGALSQLSTEEKRGDELRKVMGGKRRKTRKMKGRKL
jgi:hypothetical protein